ncbi:hypothetical protein N9L14_00605 [Alphaproteobacteria bacterium]|nr:hypothetical protein [Alphaproteobacteria bacterium]
MAKHLQIRSNRQLIRLWYECLQICHSQGVFTDNLKRSEPFYREWGNVTDLDFAEWWKRKKHLFEDQQVKEIQRVSSNPYVINVSIPLNRKISNVLSDVKELVQTRQHELMDKLGQNETTQKSKYPKVGKYTFSQKEIKGRYLYQNLEMYKIFLKHDQPAINKQFLVTLYEDLKGRPRSLLAKSIYLLNDELYEKSNVDLDNEIRSIRRGIKSVEKTLNNVSIGKFP